MQIEIAYGKEGLTIEVPDRNLAKVLRMTEKPVITDPYSATVDKLNAPSGTLPLEELARGKKTACIVINDITRPVPNTIIVPPIIEALEKAGIESHNITLLIATGIHRPNEGKELTALLGEELPKKYCVVNHMSLDLDSHEYLGETPRYKAPIYVDRTFLEADLKIITGLIEPHLMAGYSGGRKAVVPGISAFETLKVLHGAECMAYEKNVEGIIDGNLFHEEALYVARLVGVDFMVNVTLNERRKITGIFAGELNEAHMEGVTFMSAQCKDTVDRPVDAVITTSAGYPLDLTFYQAVKGMTAAQGILKEGGVLIIAAKLGEGIGSPDFTRLITETETIDEFLENIRKPDYLVLDQWQFQKFCDVLKKHEVWLYSDGIDSETQKKLFVTPLESIEEGIGKAKARFCDDCSIAVIPEGPYVLSGIS